MGTMTPEQVAMEMEEFRRSTAYFAEHEADLRRRYDDMWIAIHAGGLVASAATQDELLRELASGGVPSNHSLIKYLSSEEPTLILLCR